MFNLKLGRSIMKNHVLVLITILAANSAFTQNNHYDLREGTIRYYDACSAYDIACIGMYSAVGKETVIGDTIINGKSYAVVHWNAVLVLEEDSTIVDTTEYLRFEDGKLYRYTENGDSLIQDFRFNVGDSLADFFPFLDPDSSVSFPPDSIIYEAVVTFADSSRHRILWGDNLDPYLPPTHSGIPDWQTFVDSVLVETDEVWLLPFGEVRYYIPYKPFYFVDSLGILYSLWNYRQMALVGVETTDGVLYGHQVDVVTSLDEQETLTAKSFELLQNYPNPFNPVTTIRYRLSAGSDVKLIVYNVLGQEIKTLVNKRQPAGVHSVTFRADGLASGVYLYKLTAGSYSAVRKMLYVK